MLAVPFLASIFPALAGPAQDIAAEFSAVGVLPKVAVACAPLREALTLADAMGTFSDGAKRPELDALLTAMRDPNSEAQQSVDLDGGFVAIDAGETSIMRLPVKGGLNDAIAIFTKPDEPEWSLDGDRAVRIESNGKRSVLTIHEGVARIRTGPETTSGQIEKVPNALTELPDAPGCAMWLHGGDAPGVPTFLSHPITFWMPFGDGEPVELRVQLPAHRDRADRPTITPPLQVSSPARPNAVFTFGVPPMSIAQDPIVQKALPEMVRRQLTLGDGTEEMGAGTVGAFFTGSHQPVFVVAVPITDKRGRSVWRRRIQKEVDKAIGEAILDKMAIRTQVMGRYTTNFILPNGLTLTMRTERGAIFFGNSHEYVIPAAEGLGEPWLDEAGMEWAASHAVTVSGEAPLPGLAEPLKVQLGAGTEGDVLLVQVSMEPGLRDPQVAAAFRSMTEARKKRRSNKPL